MLNNFANSYSVLPGFGLGVGIFTISAILLFILAVGLLALKGYSLWIAARRDDKGWFVALLILNTVGILELIYLYFIADIWQKKKVHKESHTHNHSTHDHSNHSHS
jgi:hypothetical protein